MGDEIAPQERVQALEALLAKLRRRMDLTIVHHSQAVENLTRRIEALERRPIGSRGGPLI
jgi:hypothetical protein